MQVNLGRQLLANLTFELNALGAEIVLGALRHSPNADPVPLMLEFWIGNGQ